jgi:hypothetical protein
LIDLHHEPDGQYKWILHIIDHFSKFLSVVALKSKKAVEVAVAIAEWIGYVEPPEIVQCDNGREFKGVLLILLKKYGVKVIHGQLHTSSTQGLVEQANGTVKTRLRAWKEDTWSKAWAMAIPEIMLKMNRTIHGATRKSPSKVRFGWKSHWNKHLSPVERTAVNIDYISNEVTSESISKKHFRLGGLAASEWTRSVRAVRDTPVADYSAPGVNTTRRVAYRPPIAVSPFLLALSVSYFKQTLWRCGQL